MKISSNILAFDVCRTHVQKTNTQLSALWQVYMHVTPTSITAWNMSPTAELSPAGVQSAALSYP